MSNISTGELIQNATEKAEIEVINVFQEINRVKRSCMAKVLRAFIENRVASSHFAGTNGYGYDDSGRDATDRVFAYVFEKEAAFVRHNFVNGTHAISSALFGVLRPGDTIVFATGEPYDTLQNVLYASTGGSLKEWGIKIIIIPLLPNADGVPELPDMNSIRISAPEAKAIYIQRSRGYSLRKSYSVAEIDYIINVSKEANPDIISIVDNCYGELCEDKEPEGDLVVGSLIKNLGSGIAETGGYITGRRNLVELCANRMLTVGTGFEVGCTLNQTRGILMGLYRAADTVAEARKTAAFAGALFSALGFKARFTNDITLLIELGTSEKVIAFCKAIQESSPIDSFLTPEPWDMPGYDCPVIMASGGFTAGSSIELSADAPLREPFAVYLQGGVSYEAARFAVLSAAYAVVAIEE